MSKNGKSNGTQAPASGGGPRQIQVSARHMKRLRALAGKYKAVAQEYAGGSASFEVFKAERLAAMAQLNAALAAERNALASHYIDESGPSEWRIDDETGVFTRQDAAPPAPAAAPPPAAPKPEAAAP